jgi:hypothetical protein
MKQQNNKNARKRLGPKLGIKPAVTTWFHSNIQSNINGVNLKRFDVAPVLAGFNAALDTAKNYESYRIISVKWRLVSQTPVNVWNGTQLMYPLEYWHAPQHNNIFPNVSRDAFNAV